MKKIDIKDKVMAEIQKHKVVMKSKSQIDIEHGLMIFMLILSFLTAILFINFLTLIITRNGSIEFLEFGRDGLKVFLANFPYIVFAITLFMIVIFYYILAQFDISYKKGANILLATFFVICVGSGITLSTSKANESVYNYSFFNPIKNMASIKNTNDKFGTLAKVIYKDNNYIITKTAKGKTLVIKYNSNTIPSENEILNDPRFKNHMQSQNLEAMRMRQQIMLSRLNKMQNNESSKIKENQMIKLIGSCNGNNCNYYLIKPVLNKSIYAAQIN